MPVPDRYPAAAPQPDELVPDPVVAREFGVTTMTLWRWTHDPALNFPPAIKIRTRSFRSRRALENFKERLVRDSIAERANRPPARGARAKRAG